MPAIADPLFLLVVLVAVRVAIWIVDASRTRRRVAEVRASSVRAGARPGPITAEALRSVPTSQDGSPGSAPVRRRDDLAA